MPRYHYREVDVFGTGPFSGNPLAVIHDAAALETTTMQQVANWINFSETAFVTTPGPDGADYSVRIFTPACELPFAGHPSVGAAHAVVEAGTATPVDGRLIQHCGSGLLPIRVWVAGGEQTILVGAPPATLRSGESGDPAVVRSLLGVDRLGRLAPQVVEIGPVWWVVELDEHDDLVGLQPDLAGLAQASRTRGLAGLAAFVRTPSAATALAVRCFCPGEGIPEDPATGSGQAAIAALLNVHGVLPAASYRASQGREMGRDARIDIQVEPGGQVFVGGSARTIVEGSIDIES